MSKLVLLLGESGSGKDRMTKESLPHLVEDYIHINFGDYILEQGIKMGIGKERDEVRRKASQETYKEMQRRAAQEIIKKVKEENKNVILNTHALVHLDIGYLPGLPYEIIKDLHPDLIVYIDVSYKTILFFREEGERKNERSKRDSLSKEETEEMLNGAKNLVYVYSALTGAPIKIVENIPKKVDYVRDQIVNSINELHKKKE